MSYGVARRRFFGAVDEAERILAEKASADRIDRMRRELDAATEVHLAMYGFDTVEVES